MENSYGKRLKQLREAKNYTQEYIANSIDIRTASISDFENNKVSIKINTLNEICNLLGITMKDFFDFDTRLPNAEAEEIITQINSHLTDLDIEKLNYIKEITIMFKQ